VNRSALFLTAAVLTAGSLALPLWGFRMSAPQYPDEALHLRVTRSAIAGDVQEIETLQQYVGIRFPETLPELRWITSAVLGLSGLLAVAAVGRRGVLASGLRWTAAGMMTAFLVGSGVLLQKRLYDVGHERTPGAPITAVKRFTPPIVGPARVGNFTVWSYPHAGAVLLALATLLALRGAARSNRRASAAVGARPRAGAEPAHHPSGGACCGLHETAARPTSSATQHLAIVVAVGICAAATSADARTWTVGGAAADFPFIVPAIAAAAEGDTVHVQPGIYREALVVGRRLVIEGDGRPLVIGTGEGSVIELHAPGCEVRGLQIEGSGTGLANRMDAGIRVAATGARILDNVMRRVYYGVVVEGAAGSEVVGNDIEGFSDLTYSKRGDGIYVYRSSNVLLRSNRVAGMRDAIYLQYARACRAEGNRVEASRYGLHDMFSDDAVLTGNTMRDCSVGANIMNCRRVTIVRNRFERNRGVSAMGLSFKECDESLIEDNDVIDNARGLQVEGSSRNRFIANRFSFNATALQLFPSAEENVFARNTFRDNLSALVLSGSESTNRWSEDGRGNYWSGYRGFDFDGDGVGESPHPLVGAFEKIEGRNPTARLFLQSPTAAALALSAGAFPALRNAIADPAPLVSISSAAGATGSSAPAVSGRVAAGFVATLSLALAGSALIKGIRPC